MIKKKWRKTFFRAGFGLAAVAAFYFGSPVSAAEETVNPQVTVSPPPTEEPLPTITPTPSVAPTPTAIPSPTPTAIPTPTPKPKKNGWITLRDGIRIRYYKNDKYVTGFQKIKGKYYFFGPKGVMKTNCWKTVNGKKYYFGQKGVGYTGLKKIGKNWYFFSKYGVLQTRNRKVENRTYFINSNGIVEAYLKGSTYYEPSGKKMSNVDAANYDTLRYAKAIVSEITTPQMSKSEKLRTCFNWVIHHYYKTTHVYCGQETWPSLFANDYLKNRLKGGNCFSDSCSFAFLAKALGYTKVNICLDTKKTVNSNAHCWAEIDGLVYDPLFAEAKSFSRNYGAPYGVYTLYPMVRVAI